MFVIKSLKRGRSSTIHHTVQLIGGRGSELQAGERASLFRGFGGLRGGGLEESCQGGGQREGAKNFPIFLGKCWIFFHFFHFFSIFCPFFPVLRGQI